MCHFIDRGNQCSKIRTVQIICGILHISRCCFWGFQVLGPTETTLLANQNGRGGGEDVGYLSEY